jgi:hypothetical protein
MSAHFSQRDFELLADLRSARRTNAFLLAFVESDGHAWPVALRNMSSKGALIEAEAGFIIGSQIVFRRSFAAIESTVVWRRGGRFGIRFEQELNAEEVTALSRRIEQKTPHLAA